VERVSGTDGEKSGSTGTSSRVTFSPHTKPCGTTTEEKNAEVKEMENKLKEKQTSSLQSLT
jgi:hypothetical protein